MAGKQTGGKDLQTKDTFFIFNLNSMQINRWQSFTEEGHLFNINGVQIKKKSGKILQIEDTLMVCK